MPRQINNLATQALVATYAQKKSTVDAAVAQAEVAEVAVAVVLGE